MTDTAPGSAITFALDATSRRYDVDGRLHVTACNISKANVCGYYGAEIPGWESLGLNPDRLYQLYRDAGELAKAAPTFNNLQLLQKHVAVNAVDPQADQVVGSTGTDAEWHAPYLRNSLVIWDAVAIARVEIGEQKEISCGYRYVPDMTPGVADGVAFDGRMTQIVGNHVALVEVGRAGPDVVVGDSQPKELETMANKKPVSRAVKAVKMALDAVAGGKLAADASVEDIKKLLGTDADPDEMDGEDEEETEEEKKARLAKRAADKAKDADPDDKEDEPVDGKDEEEDEDDKKNKKAMDAAIDAVRVKIAADAKEFRAAERAVRPYVGDLALDAAETADDVYRAALKLLGIAADGVNSVGLRAMLKMAPLPGSKPTVVAMDAKSASDFATRFPSTTRIVKA